MKRHTYLNCGVNKLEIENFRSGERFLSRNERKAWTGFEPMTSAVQVLLVIKPNQKLQCGHHVLLSSLFK